MNGSISIPDLRERARPSSTRPHTLIFIRLGPLPFCKVSVALYVRLFVIRAGPRRRRTRRAAVAAPAQCSLSHFSWSSAMRRCVFLAGDGRGSGACVLLAGVAEGLAPRSTTAIVLF